MAEEDKRYNEKDRELTQRSDAEGSHVADAANADGTHEESSVGSIAMPGGDDRAENSVSTSIDDE